MFEFIRRLFAPRSPEPPNPLADLSVDEQQDLANLPPLLPGWLTWTVVNGDNLRNPAVVQILPGHVKSEHCRRTRLRYILTQRENQRRAGCVLSDPVFSTDTPLGFEECRKGDL